MRIAIMGQGETEFASSVFGNCGVLYTKHDRQSCRMCNIMQQRGNLNEYTLLSETGHTINYLAVGVVLSASCDIFQIHNKGKMCFRFGFYVSFFSRHSTIPAISYSFVRSKSAVWIAICRGNTLTLASILMSS